MSAEVKTSKAGVKLRRHVFKPEKNRGDDLCEISASPPFNFDTCFPILACIRVFAASPNSLRVLHLVCLFRLLFLYQWGLIPRIGKTRC
jgi:hypothetical protein